MFCESIPSSVLQVYALFGADEVTNTAIFSIVSSAMAIAFASTTISVDFDTDPSKRLISPNYYGYMPDENRLLVFGLMTIMTAAHVLMKVLACSLMLRLSQVWFWLYMSLDMGVYFLFKITRGDFRYWIDISGVLGWVATFFMRLLGKTITDFTLLVQLRGQLELGGMYWSLNMILNQLFCFISVFLYTRFVDTNSNIEQAHNNSISIVNATLCNSTDIGNAVNTGCDATELPLLELVSGLFILSMLCFAGFLKLIKKEYLWTFYDRRTGSQFVVATFHEVESEAMKFEVFGWHPSLYKSIEEELKTWLEDNWERWEEEKEAWFNAIAISTVPEEYLPKKALSDMGGVTGRKASIIKMKAEKGKVGRERRGSDLKIIPMG